MWRGSLLRKRKRKQIRGRRDEGGNKREKGRLVGVDKELLIRSITSFIQNVAIAPNVQPSSPRQTVLPTQRHQLSCISPQPAHEDWPLSLVTESAAMRHQGRTDSRVHSPGSADLGTLFLPRLWGKLRKFQRSRNNKQCCLSTNVQNWPKITLNGKWLFLGSVSRKIKSPALISM